ncbi:hypothetical protein, partial [Serratia sp. 506_PEND]|uniref:hypothetical protein n=1 Tax=Serratia sp. 506_PEND TaxID=1572666 RepID=UPI000661673D
YTARLFIQAALLPVTREKKCIVRIAVRKTYDCAMWVKRRVGSLAQQPEVLPGLKEPPPVR